ncbi:MAG: Druantia anti-phage system protein DruA [Desulfuromonadaceae bacterium]
MINNSRFLIFPWGKIKYLASHALGHAVRRIGGDWQQRWGYRPVVVETFVDPERYTGTCYRAANWLYVGDTTGTGLARQGKSYTSSPKKIFDLHQPSLAWRTEITRNKDYKTQGLYFLVYPQILTGFVSGFA